MTRPARSGRRSPGRRSTRTRCITSRDRHARDPRLRVAAFSQRFIKLGESSRRDPPAPATATPLRVERAPIPAYVTWTFCAYVLLLPVGDLVLRWVNVAAGGSEINHDRSIFAVV